jgi:hypothetical protein
MSLRKLFTVIGVASSYSSAIISPFGVEILTLLIFVFLLSIVNLFIKNKPPTFGGGL